MDTMRKKYKHVYKAVLCDVDGTLATNESNGKITKKVYESIIKAKQKVTIGIASGRPLEGVSFLFKQLGLKKPCIINGGAQIIHPVSRKILWEKTILTKDLRTITTIINKLSGKIWVVDNGKEKLYTKNLSIHKPLSFFIPKIQEKKADAIIRKLSENHTLTLKKVVTDHQNYISLHITNAKATKKYAALKLAELLQIKNDDIIGVGNEDNDYPLLNACGLRVAVGNAIPGLKKLADYIAPSVYEDGVADVIEKFVFQKFSI
jgi:HAD superfamily hydrolase (TIGR01484 family)